MNFYIKKISKLLLFETNPFIGIMQQQTLNYWYQSPFKDSHGGQHTHAVGVYIFLRRILY